MPPQTSVMPARRSLETASMWALAATIIAAIVIFIPSSSFPFAATKSFVLAGGALVTLALYILARLSRGNVIFPPVLLVGALWLPMLAYALSALFSGVSFANALWGTGLETETFGFMLATAGLGTLSALILRRREQYRSFLVAGAYAFGFVAVVQLLFVLAGQVMPKTISPAFSVVGTLEDLALLMGLGVILALLTLRFVELPSRARLAMLLGGAIALFLLAIANSSLVWILVALVSLGLFVEAVMKRRPTSADGDLDDAAVISEAPAAADAGNRSLVVPLVVLAISLFFLIGGTLGNALAGSLHVNVLNVRPSWQSTLSVVRKTYSTSPVFGTGPGTFDSQWLKYRDASLNSTVFWNVDFNSGIGFIPTSLVTTGLVGALAWVVMLVLLLGLGLRMLILRAPQDAFTRYVAIISFVGAAYLFVAAIFDVPGAVLLALAFVFAGVFASTMRFASGGGQWGVIFARSPRLGFAIVFSLTILLLVSVAAAYALVERYISAAELTRASAALSAGNTSAAQQAVQSSLVFASTPAAYQLEAGIAVAQLSEIAASSTIPTATAAQQFQSALSAGINAALTATRLDPTNYQNWMALGNLYAQAVPLKVSGAYDSARTAYEKAEALSPTNPQIPYILAQLDIADGNLSAAQDDLKASIALKQDYTAAIFLLSQLEVQQGNVKDALTAAEAAAYFTPNDPNILFQVGILRAAQGDLTGAAQALNAAVAANVQFANARYFLAAVEAKRGDLQGALAQMQAIAALSGDNAKAVEGFIAALQAGKNPFPANLLSASSTPVH